MRRAATLTVVAGLAVAATACSSGSSGSGASATAKAVSTPNANGCTAPPPLQKVHQQYSSEPKLTIARTTYTARIVTNCGTIIVSLDGKNAPHTVNSFAFLAHKGYFDDTACLRVTTVGNRLLQCGDPTGTGAGGPGYTLPDENLAHANYPAGTVAIANAGRPHSGGSQFFILYGNAELPPHYTPFGHVTAGLDVVKKVAAAGSTPPGDGSPNQPIVIESFGVTKG